MKKMDKGEHIRTYNGYENLLLEFIFEKKVSYYLRFYSHLLSFKNIDRNKINHYF